MLRGFIVMRNRWVRRRRLHGGAPTHVWGSEYVLASGHIHVYLYTHRPWSLFWQAPKYFQWFAQVLRVIIRDRNVLSAGWSGVLNGRFSAPIVWRQRRNTWKAKSLFYIIIHIFQKFYTLRLWLSRSHLHRRPLGRLSAPSIYNNLMRAIYKNYDTDTQRVFRAKMYSNK